MVNSQALVNTLLPGKRLLVFLHDNPDPDSIASGWLLARIAKKLGLKAEIVHGGRLGRPENRTMVRLLKIPTRSLSEHRFRYLKSDRFALVDTQPGTGNNSFPHEKHTCHVVIDHHPARRQQPALFQDIRLDQGCTTSIVLAYFLQLGLELDSALATAIAYAIISETQDLEREATKEDTETYQLVFPYLNHRILGKIRHPMRSRAYFETIARAMQQVLVSRNTCVCHIGRLDEAEIVAEVADFLAAMERISWCLVTGYYGAQMILSIRTCKAKGRAEKVMKRMLKRVGKGGGHGMIAGGYADLESTEKYPELCEMMTKRFLAALRRKHTENLRPIMGEKQFCTEKDSPNSDDKGVGKTNQNGKEKSNGKEKNDDSSAQGNPTEK